MNDAGFRRELDLKPDDWSLRLIYADWLEEQGETERARLQRWLVENKRYPEFDHDCWRWLNSSAYPPERSAVLPLYLYEPIMERCPMPHHGPYDTRAEAEDGLLCIIDVLFALQPIVTA